MGVSLFGFSRRVPSYVNTVEARAPQTGQNKYVERNDSDVFDGRDMLGTFQSGLDPDVERLRVPVRQGCNDVFRLIIACR